MGVQARQGSTAMTHAQELGRYAEDRAAEYLASIGWRVVARNVRNSCGELDIIALDPKARELVIVEVRARTLGLTQSPLESVGSRKLRTLLKASRLYVEEINWTGFWRIDVVGITIKAPGDWELEHVKDITAGMNVSC